MQNKPTHKSIYRRFTPEERAMFEKAKREDEEDMEELKALGRAMFARFETMQRVLQTLKAARIKQGLSLADVDERTGMGKGNLSRLENDPRANPTLETLLRLAEAIGVELRIAVVDKEAGNVIDTSAA